MLTENLMSVRPKLDYPQAGQAAQSWVELCRAGQAGQSWVGRRYESRRAVEQAERIVILASLGMLWHVQVHTASRTLPAALEALRF